jgi:hypothetical protein
MISTYAINCWNEDTSTYIDIIFREYSSQDNSPVFIEIPSENGIRLLLSVSRDELKQLLRKL